jgi:hypothetical protein
MLRKRVRNHGGPHWSQAVTGHSKEPVMTAKTEVITCSELSPGDQVEALRDGLVLHRGRVLAVVPALELFWILDARTGTRQLLDLEMLRVLRCPVRAVPDLPDPEPSAG